MLQPVPIEEAWMQARGSRRLAWAVATGLFGVAFAAACVLPKNEEMHKFAEAAPMCRSVEAWEVYTGALSRETAGMDSLASLERAGECVSVKAGTVVEEISLDGKIPPDAIAVRFAKWAQEDANGPVSGVTWRKNITSWKFRESGAWVNPLK